MCFGYFFIIQTSSLMISSGILCTMATVAVIGSLLSPASPASLLIKQNQANFVSYEIKLIIDWQLNKNAQILTKHSSAFLFAALRVWALGTFISNQWIGKLTLEHENNTFAIFQLNKMHNCLELCYHFDIKNIVWAKEQNLSVYFYLNVYILLWLPNS